MSTDRDETPARALQVCTRLNVGGPSRHIEGLARWMSPDFTTEVAAGLAPPEEGTLPVTSAPVHQVPLHRRPHPRDDLRAVRALERLIRARGPSVVATHMAKAGVLGRLAAWRCPQRPATVHTFHGHLLEGYFTAPARATALEVERRLARRTDALVAMGARVRDELLDAGVGREEQWHVLPLVVDLSGFAPERAVPGRLRAALGLPRDAVVVGAVGRLAEVKDLGVLLRAVTALPDVHVALVGDGPCRGELHRLAHRLGIAERTHITGWWRDVAEVYPDLDVVALTSRNEGTPSALVEAAAAARPVVASDVGGVAQVLAGGRGGLLVAPRSPSALAAALRAVLDDPASASARAELARRHVLEHFDAPAAAAAHAALYERLRSGRGAHA